MNYETLESRLTTAGQHAKINWTDGDQYGEIIFTFDPVSNKYTMDTECLRLSTVIEIIKSIK